MKRSAQIGLVLMGALGVTGASAYYSAKRDEACQRPPQAGARINPQGAQAPQAGSQAPQAGSQPQAASPAPAAGVPTPQAGLQPGALTGPQANPDPNCRRRSRWWSSSSSGSSGYRRSYFWRDSSTPGTRTSFASTKSVSTSSAPSTARSGFGSTGRAVASSGG